jgi:hypothetical membrane protein
MSQSVHSSTSQHPSGLVQLGGLLWLLTLVYFISQGAAQLVFSPPYNLIDDRISDLGNTTCGPWLTHAFACSPLSGLMNATFIATGVLMVLGAALTWSVWPHRRLTTAGLGCLMLAGVGYMLVGFNPENVNLRLHLLGATNLVTSNLALLLLGLGTRRFRPTLATVSLVLAGTGLLGLLCGPLLMAVFGHGGGIAERLVLYPLVIWTVIAGAACLLAKPCSALTAQRGTVAQSAEAGG